MSRPTAISSEEQEQIARRIGVMLLQAAPEDWQQITVEYRATGEYHDLLGEVVAQDGTSRPMDVPEELLSIFEHLREGMYRPDVGTWLSALYVVDRPSSYRIDINFDSEPHWSRPLPRAAYVDELRRYPRADENVPDWMRAYLDGSGTAEPQAATTAEIPETAGAPEFTQDDAPTADVPRFSTAVVFDDYDDQGRPVVATRIPVPQEDVAALRHYLENAPIVLASRDNELDQLDPEQPASVPATWHTDGMWLWPGAVPFYLAQYGVPPEQALIEHIRHRQFTLSEVDDQTREAAANALLDQPEDVAEEPPEPAAPAPPVAPPVEPPAAMPPAPPLESPVPEAATPPPAAPPAPEPEMPSMPEPPPAVMGDGAPDVVPAPPVAEPPMPDMTATPVPDVPTPEPEPPAPPEPVSEPRHSIDDVPSAAVEEPVELPEPEPEPEPVFARLHDRLNEYNVDSTAYRIGSHSTGAWCLVQEGPDWIVTADEPGGEDVRFAKAEQAAAYLLGRLLLDRPASVPAPPHSEPVAGEPGPVAEPPAAPEMPVPAVEPPSAAVEAPETARPSERAEPAASESGGHFLFTANQGPAVQPEQPVEPAPEPVAEQAPEPSARPDPAGPSGSEEPTRFQPMPRVDRPAGPPPGGPQSPPTGQPAQPSGPPQQGGAAIGGLGGLPKRTKRNVPPEGASRPPAQQPGPVAQPGGPDRRPPGPGMTQPPRQGAAPQPGGQRPPQERPPQGGPGGTPQQQPAGGREQQIQPLRGEPPLTLYRERRAMVLQPGTELDRFGEPSGNVMYAIRTPYAQRSLPPQWANRPYFAYRVQRPLQTLRGTAVPWFEQPGGGTAYVLPAAVGDLVADGTLVEIPTNEAPRPPME